MAFTSGGRKEIRTVRSSFKRFAVRFVPAVQPFVLGSIKAPAPIEAIELPHVFIAKPRWIDGV